MNKAEMKKFAGVVAGWRVQHDVLVMLDWNKERQEELERRLFAAEELVHALDCSEGMTVMVHDEVIRRFKDRQVDIQCLIEAREAKLKENPMSGWFQELFERIPG